MKTTAQPTLVFLLSLLALPSAALAQVDPAKAADKSKPAEAPAAAPAEAPKDFTQEAQATLGALFNDGNTSALAGRVGGYWQGRYLSHGLRFDAGAGIASVAQDPEADPADGFDLPLFDAKNPMNTTALGRGRYDFFLGADDSLYGAGFAFHDSAANLAARLRGELGYRHFFFQVPKHAFSGEVGLVWTADNAPFDGDTNHDGQISVADDTRFEDSGGTLGARVMLGYTNALMDNLSYTSTLEVVPNLFPDVEAPFESARTGEGDQTLDNKLGLGEATVAVWNHTLTANVSQQLGIGFALTLAWDNGAIARRNAYTNHDLAASLQLTYKLF